MQEEKLAASLQNSPTNTSESSPSLEEIIAAVTSIVRKYELTAVEPLLEVCTSALQRADLLIAILGRFKAGKTSFLNQLLGRNLLPTGVLPVTSVITEIRWAPEERAEVIFLDGRMESVPIAEISNFISEARNPRNSKQVSRVSLYLPDLHGYKGLRLIDTPGLESALTHNQDVSLAWAPNVDVAIVAISVDPPLTQQDVDLIRRLFQYTPRLYVLLTKVDTLSAPDLVEVLTYVEGQLAEHLDRKIEVFPYSTKPEFAALKRPLENILSLTAGTVHEQKTSIITHKLQLLVRESGDYLQVGLQSAQMLEADRQRIQNTLLRDKQNVVDTKLELHLIARHVVNGARSRIERLLLPHYKLLERKLTEQLEREYPMWKMSFARLLSHFQEWLNQILASELGQISDTMQPAFLEPLADIRRQYVRLLQAFRDRFSNRVEELFGIPLRTNETEIEVKPPAAIDINISPVFDHYLEPFSAVLSIPLLRGPVKRRLLHRIQEETFKNLSRLTTQWTDIVADATLQMQNEASRRLDNLIATVDRLTRTSATNLNSMELDAARLRQVADQLNRK